MGSKVGSPYDRQSIGKRKLHTVFYFYCYAQFLQQFTYLLLFIFIWLAVAPSHLFCLYRALLAIQLLFTEFFFFFIFRVPHLKVILKSKWTEKLSSMNSFEFPI